jgi:D-3-phosphoglycerate dehydrogenase
VYVANCPGKNAEAVAELAMAFLLGLDRRLCDGTQSLREGRWEKQRFSAARGIYGRRLGVVGLGAIGRLVADRARGFGMEVSAWSRSLTMQKAQKLGIGYASSLVDLARRSDALTLHLPLTQHTRHIVDRRVLEALPEGAIFVNTARSELVDTAALLELTDKKRLRVGLDVFDDEPKGATADFTALFASAGKNGVVYATPHIGASTDQAQHAISREVSRIVRAFMTEEVVPNVVNLAKTTPARWALVLRARDEVGVLANVLGVIKRHGLNIEEVANHVFEGATATCVKLRLSGRPSDECLREIRAFDEVLHVDVVPLPNLA